MSNVGVLHMFVLCQKRIYAQCKSFLAAWPTLEWPTPPRQQGARGKRCLAGAFWTPPRVPNAPKGDALRSNACREDMAIPFFDPAHAMPILGLLAVARIRVVHGPFCRR